MRKQMKREYKKPFVETFIIEPLDVLSISNSVNTGIKNEYGEADAPQRRNSVWDEYENE